MDGVRYHKRRTDKKPTSANKSANKKATILAWLQRKGIEATSGQTKDELLSLAASVPISDSSFEVVKLAERWGHSVLYTPRYHCELQPIEGVWGVVKGRIAIAPVKTEDELHAKLTAAF